MANLTLKCMAVSDYIIDEINIMNVNLFEKKYYYL